MKILHLADLHIGKKVNDFCMLKEQKYVLEQAINLAKKEEIEAVLTHPIPPFFTQEVLFSFQPHCFLIK